MIAETVKAELASQRHARSTRCQIAELSFASCAAWIDYLVYAALALVFLKNDWVSEDAYLNFRSVDRLRSGHGPRWNPHERVQVFTSPLWYGLHAFVQLIVRDGYLAVLLLSSACFGLALPLLRQISGSTFGFALAGLRLIGSNTCFDYTSSGQENVLGYALGLYYLRAYLDLFEGQSEASARPRANCAGCARDRRVPRSARNTRLRRARTDRSEHRARRAANTRAR